MPERQSQELKTSGAQIDESEFEKPRTLGKKKKCDFICQITGNGVFAVGTLGVCGVHGVGSDFDFKTKNYRKKKKDLKI